MDSKAKRRVFRDAFKDRLFENGFVYRNNMFVRIHPSEAMLSVSLSLMPSGNSYICFDALPLCCEFKTQPFIESERMDGYCHIWSKETNDPKLDEPWGIPNFGLQYREFWDNIFNDLNAVHDIECVYTFTRNLPYKLNAYKYVASHPYIDIHSVETIYSGIFVQAWDVVLDLLNKVMPPNAESISRVTNEVSILESKPRKGKYDDLNIGYLKEFIAGRQQQQNRWNTIKTMIENGDRAGLNQILTENRTQWDAYCNEKWPMFYRS